MQNKFIVCFTLLTLIFPKYYTCAMSEESNESHTSYKKLIILTEEDSLLGDHRETSVELEPIDNFTEEESLLNIETSARANIKNNMIFYINKYLIADEKIPENNKKRRIRQVAKVFLPILLGATTGITLISPAAKAVHNIPGLSQIVSAGTYITMAGASSWVGLKFGSQFDPVSPEEENILIHKNKYKLSKQLTSYFVAILTSIPDIFAAYKYNNSVIWYMLPSFAYSMVSKQLGFYEFIDTLLTIGKKTSKVRDLVVEKSINEEVVGNLLDNNTYNVEDLKMTTKANILELLDTLEDENQFDFSTEAKKIKKTLYPKRVLQAVFLIFPIGNAIVNGMLTYQALEKIYASVPFQGIGAAIVVLPSLSLDIAFTIDAASEVFDSVYNKIKGYKKRSFLETFYPISSSYIIPIVAFPLSLCLATTSFYMVHDTVSGYISQPIRYIVPGAVAGANVILGTYALIHIEQETLKGFVSFFSNVKEKSMLYINEKIESASKFLFSYFSEAK